MELTNSQHAGTTLFDLRRTWRRALRYIVEKNNSFFCCFDEFSQVSSRLIRPTCWQGNTLCLLAMTLALLNTPGCATQEPKTRCPTPAALKPLTERAKTVALGQCSSSELVGFIEDDGTPFRVQSAAVGLLSDEGDLEHIALHNETYSIGRTATARIETTASLLRIALQSAYRSTAMAASLAIDDSSALDEITQNSRWLLAQHTASLKSKGDEAIFQELAEIDSWKHRGLDSVELEVYQQLLVSAIQSKTLLQQIVQDRVGYGFYAIRPALQELNDSVFAARVAKTGESWGIRAVAIPLVTDQDVLMELALNEGRREVYGPAFRQLTDQDRLLSIVESSHSIERICLAFDNLYDQQMLSALSKRTDLQGQLAGFLSIVRSDDMLEIYRNQRLKCDNDFVWGTYEMIKKEITGIDGQPRFYWEERRWDPSDIPTHYAFTMGFKYDSGQPETSTDISAPIWRFEEKAELRVVERPPTQIIGSLYRRVATDEHVPHRIRKQALANLEEMVKSMKLPQ